AAKAVMGVRDGGASVADNEALAEALAAVKGGKAAFFAAEVTDAMLGEMGREASILEGWVKAGDYVAASLDISGDLVLRVALVAKDEDRVQKLEGLWEGSKAFAEQGLEEVP